MKKLSEILNTIYINDAYAQDLEMLLKNNTDILDISGCVFSRDTSYILSHYIYTHNGLIIDSRRDAPTPPHWTKPYPFSHYNRIIDNEKRSQFKQEYMPLPELDYFNGLKILSSYIKNLRNDVIYRVCDYSKMDSIPEDVALPLVYLIQAIRPDVLIQLDSYAYSYCKLIWKHLISSEKDFKEILSITDRFIVVIDRIFEYIEISEDYKFSNTNEKISYSTISSQIFPIPAIIGSKCITESPYKAIFNDCTKQMLCLYEKACDNHSTDSITLKSLLLSKEMWNI